MKVKKGEPVAKGATEDLTQGGQRIILQNPVREHFPKFIVGNALQWETMVYDSLVEHAPEKLAELGEFTGLLGCWDRPGTEAYEQWQRFRRVIDDHCPDPFMVRQNSAKGQTLVLCGAGPTLRDHAAKWCPKGDQVWGCNSAASWLADNGHPITHAVTVDQTAHMVTEWGSAPDIEYLCASTVHPHLTEHLLKHNRRIRWFHNFVGIEAPPVEWEGYTMSHEDWLYCLLFPPTIRVGSGLNTVTRAIDLALFMGFGRIILLGADCALKVKKRAPKGTKHGTAQHRAWLERDTIMHADGGSALASEATETTIEGTIDGRYWLTKPDMMITAVWLVRWRRKLTRKRLTIIGDTLVNALQDKTDEYLDQLPALTDEDGKPLRFFEMMDVAGQVDQIPTVGEPTKP